MGGRAEDALTSSGQGVRYSPFSLLLLAAAIAIGAYLRFNRLGEPSFWLDEILHQQLTTTFAAKPWWQWFGRLHEEHAGLYYLTQIATRVFGTNEFAGRLAAALFGLATIPLLWLAPLERRARGAAVLLLAVSPLHVYYSREARGYALLLFLTAALVLILLRGRSVAAACVVLLALTYSSAVASTVVVSAAAISFLIALVDRDRRRWYATVGTCATVALAFFRVIYGARPVADPSWPPFPPIDWQFLTSLARMFSVSALGTEIGGRAAVAMLVFASIGAIAIAKHDRVQGMVLIGMTVLPLAITLAALRLFDHFFAVRYVLPGLIGWLWLAGIGIAFVARLATARFAQRGAWVASAVAAVIVVVLAAQAWDAARREPFQKLDWRGIAAALRRHARPGDVILAAEPWSDVSLRYYLGEIAGVKLVYMRGPGIAEIVTKESAAAWLVTAGSSADVSVRQWMCRYPVLLSSPLEGFRLHYAPSSRHFLQERSGPPEQRAASAALGEPGFTLRMGPEVDVVLGNGWADAEGSGDDTFRWAVGRRATLMFPRRERRDRVIRFHAYPASPQTMSISLNGKPIGAIALAPQWSDYSLDVPAALWSEGMNELAFDFEKAFPPSPSDRRELAACFQRISIDDRGFASTTSRVPVVRIAAHTFIDANSAWRNTRTRFSTTHLRRDSVEALLGRLGFDPVAGWTRLARGDIRLEDIAKTIAAGSDCEDDATFLRRAFAIILERHPNDIEKSDLLRRLREGATRQHVIGRIVRSDDFRRRVMR